MVEMTNPNNSRTDHIPEVFRLLQLRSLAILSGDLASYREYKKLQNVYKKFWGKLAVNFC